MVDVVVAVRQAIEVLTGQGAKAIDLGRVRGGGEAGSALPVDEAALELWAAVLMLPPEHNLALMWKVLKDNPRLGTEALQDLTCFAERHLTTECIRPGEINPYFIPAHRWMGRDVLFYWVRHWARDDGSSREASFLFGKGYDTHQRFYRDNVKPMLKGWLYGAEAALRPILITHAVEHMECG